MDWSNGFEQLLNQSTELQRQFFKSWASVMPGMQNSNAQNMRENFDNALDFQERLVTSSLEFQTLLARLTIECQKQLWQNYFNLLRSK